VIGKLLKRKALEDFQLHDEDQANLKENGFHRGGGDV
jgi:hypothetical protein